MYMCLNVHIVRISVISVFIFDRALSNLKEFLTKCFGCDVPPKYLLKYFEAVEALGYDSKPGYKDLCTIFKDELKRSGMKDDNRDLDWNLAAKGKTPTKAKSPKVLKKVPNIVNCCIGATMYLRACTYVCAF